MQERVMESYALSPQQRHLCALAPGGLKANFPYRSQVLVRLGGELFASRLREAFSQVSERYEILRTTFVRLPGLSLPTQQIHATSLLSWQQQDLLGLSPAEQQAALAKVREQGCKEPIDLREGPMLFVQLIRLGQREHALCLTQPALSGDVISAQLLLREVSRCYEQGQAGLAEEALQYADLAQWQTDLLTSAETAAERTYWRDLKRMTSSEWILPGEQKPGQEEDFLPANIEEELSPTLLGELDQLAEQSQVSRAAVLLTAWATVLTRLTQENQICIGVGFPGRSYEELTQAIGLLGKYLPVTYPMKKKLSCREMILAVQKELDEAEKWQEYFGWDREQGQESSQEELYSAFGFDYATLPGAWHQAGVRWQIEEQEQWLDRFKVSLSCLGEQERLHIRLGYDQFLFTPQAMQRLLEQWLLVLEQIVENPQRRLWNLRVITAEEWELMQEHNATHVSLPEQMSIVDLFEDQVARTPERVALRFEGKHLRYQDLEGRANQLAHVLRERGVGPEVCVGVCLERSVELVIAILGILKAGGAYVPLDPGAPSQRLAFLMQEANLALLLTQESLLEQLPDSAVEMICLDRDWPQIALQSSARLVSGVRKENLAYVLYTSGSTGQPKGVMIQHASLLNYVWWACQAYEVEQGTGSLLHSPLTFDLSLTALFPPLLSGGWMHILPESPGVEELAQALQSSQGLSLLKLTPTHLDLLAHQVPAQALADRVRVLVIGGEALRGHQLSFWREHAPTTRMINEYGPTETVVGCCVYEVPADWSEQGGSVPIGTPIANTRLYVLDEQMQPVPLGVAGELYIGGEGLARGYLGQPALTASSFVPDPFAQQAGGRLYRTGDRVRALSDGTLLFLGRLDEQIKIHGYRIEPAEIETRLLEHPAVQEAVVLARREVEGDQRLLAYVVGETEASLSSEELRNFLSSVLPDYMLPSYFIALDRLPVTANGKLDREALPSPQQGYLQTGSTYVAPRTPQEEILAGIWAQVLGLEQVGIDENYFALGGDSIRSIQVVAQAGERGLSLSIDQLFRAPTIRLLVQTLLSEQAEEGHRQEVGVVNEPFALLSVQDRARLPEGVEDAYPLSLLQGGMLFHNEYSPGAGVYHDIFSYHVRLAVDVVALQTAAQALVERHPVLRTAFEFSRYSQPLQLVYQQGEPILSFEDIRGYPVQQQQELIHQWIEQEKERGFEWNRLPLLRIHIHLRSEDRAQFSLSFHHAIIDGWSDATLLTELFSHYFALLKGQSFTLAPPAAHYRDFVALEQATLTSAAAQQYWDRTLTGSSFTQIPRWEKPEQEREAGVIVEPVLISEEVSRGLKQLALSTAVPIKHVLLAGHLRVLSLLSGQQDVTTCVVSSGRPEGPDGERVLGLFINSIPFRLQLGGGSWQELVKQSFEREREAMPYRRYPMAELKRRHGGLQLSETLFYFTHYHIFRGLQELGDVEVLELIPHEVSSFPLVANFWVDPFSSSVNLSLTCDKGQFSEQQVQLIAGYYATVLKAMATDPQDRYELCDLLSPTERTTLLQLWNATTAPTSQECIHDLIAAEATRNPEAIAIVSKGEQLRYRELEQKANQLAHVLREREVGPEVCVGVCLERSLELVVAILGILKAGGAYVPLDPSYPAERLAFLMQDSSVPVLLTQESLLDQLPDSAAEVICLDRDWPQIALQSSARLVSGVRKENLAYVLYTSGSTGQPKGVMVEHRNVTNFFNGMDHFLGDDVPGVWLAVTSISFDISALELFWTLSRGFKVILQQEQDLLNQAAQNASRLIEEKPIDFSLFYFASDEDENDEDKYRLLIEGAKFADKHGFSAIWTPERHFHTFGGLYPNPSVTGAAIAAVTKHIQIRAGSVVLPLHNPIRVAEEWSVVDNLSRGRVGLSIASGWHVHDFILAPGNYANRRDIMVRSIETVQRLWRKEAVTFAGDDGSPIEVQIHPRPVQDELPIWLTAAGNPATFRAAGEMGVNLLTHLLGQNLEELAEKIQLYRDAWRSVGDRTGDGHVTLMLHTFIGEDIDAVREKVRQPFCNYLRHSLDLVKDLAKTLGYTGNPRTFNEDDIEALLSHAFERYFETSGLFGTPDHCLDLIEKLKNIGVDEIACLIDFGVDCDAVLTSLQGLNEVKNRSHNSSMESSSSYSVAEQILRHNVSHLQCTPSLARVLATDDQTLSAMGNLRKFVLGGEVLPAALANQIVEVIPADLYNMYGPTETTIWSTVYSIEQAKEAMSIGHPINNTQIYILDPHLQPVPIGVAGDLYIGGAGVVRGYLKRPDLTAERFIVDPFSSIPGSRLYKTGDIARYLPDGNIEFLGRDDHQTKVRGHRIELGEIETVLGMYSSVHECVVATYTTEAEEKRLVAYIVPEPGTNIVINEVRNFLKEKLPAYMVPSDFVLLDALPLTPNKKINRQALPLPVASHQEILLNYVAPRTPIEEILADAWSEILGIGKVGIHDTFFELGGYSLQATQLISRLRTIFQINLPLRSLFETPTIAGLSKQVETALQLKKENHVQPLIPVPHEGYLPLSFAQLGIWFLEQLTPNNTSYNEPAAVSLRGKLDRDVLERSLNDIVQRHEALRFSFTIFNGQPVHIIQSNIKLPLLFSDLSHLSKDVRDAEVQNRATQAIQTPFDLNVAPLLRAVLLRLDEDEHILLLIMHHIVSDGWSMGIFVKELAVLYRAYLQGGNSPLVDLPIQYSDYAFWQRQWLQGEVLDEHLAYWKTQLHALPVSQLPVDHPRPSIRTFRGATHFFQLPTSLLAGLKRLGREEGATLFMGLMASFKILLYSYSGQQDVVVGTDVANRNRLETEALIGLFVNQLVLRTSLTGNPTVREVVRRVREVALQAYGHQELPFDRLVEALNPERDLSQTPLFQVKFVLQNAPTQLDALLNMTMKSVEVERGTSKFDLLLNISEDQQKLFGWLEYNTDIFEYETIKRLTKYFEFVLHQLVEYPDTQLDALKGMLAIIDQEEQAIHEQELEQASLQKLGELRRRRN